MATIAEDRKELASYGVQRARANLAELVNRAAYGRERIVITAFGRERAAIVPIADLNRLLESAA